MLLLFFYMINLSRPSIIVAVFAGRQRSSSSGNGSGTSSCSGTSRSEGETSFSNEGSSHYLNTFNEAEWDSFVDKIRHVLRLHFLTPWQKWSVRGLLPLRATIQLISVIIFSIQVQVTPTYAYR